MKPIRMVAAAVFAALVASPALPRDWVLDCEMTDYRRAKLSGVNTSGTDSVRLRIRELVPPSARHIVKIPNTRIEGTELVGRSEFDGKCLTMKYETRRDYFGEIRVTYFYHLGTSAVSARVWTQKPGGNHDGGQLEGITGHCTLRR